VLVLLSHKIRDRVFIWIATARCSILAYLHPDRGAGMDGGSSEGSEALRRRAAVRDRGRCAIRAPDLPVDATAPDRGGAEDAQRS
jgi:hypothetical protein